MPHDNKWVFSSSGHHMFVSFSVDIFIPHLRFTAKIHQGKKINYYQNFPINSKYKNL